MASELEGSALLLTKKRLDIVFSHHFVVLAVWECAESQHRHAAVSVKDIDEEVSDDYEWDESLLVLQHVQTGCLLYVIEYALLRKGSESNAPHGAEVSQS